MGCPQTHICQKCGGKCTGCSGCVLREGLCPGCYSAKKAEEEKQKIVNVNKPANSTVQ